MVELDALAPAAAACALDALEQRRRSQVQGRLQLGGLLATEVLDLLDIHAVVQKAFEERVLRVLARDAHRDRSDAEQVAELVALGVTPSQGIEVHDHDDFGPGGGAGPEVVHHAGEGFGRVHVHGLAPARPLGLAQDALGLGVHPREELGYDLGRQFPAEAAVAEPVQAMDEVLGLVLALGTRVGIHR